MAYCGLFFFSVILSIIYCVYNNNNRRWRNFKNAKPTSERNVWTYRAGYTKRFSITIAKSLRIQSILPARDCLSVSHALGQLTFIPVRMHLSTSRVRASLETVTRKQWISYFSIRYPAIPGLAFQHRYRYRQRRPGSVVTPPVAPRYRETLTLTAYTHTVISSIVGFAVLCTCFLFPTGTVILICLHVHISC